MIYLDSSALVKLVVTEAETGALEPWLADTDQPLASSALARVEVVRASRSIEAALTDRAERLCWGIDLVPLDPDLLREAALLAPATLRSLDAIHLASALRLAEAGPVEVVAYDRRLLEAARAVGLATVSPGEPVGSGPATMEI